MGRFFVRVEAHARRVPCEKCSEKTEQEEDIEVKECNNAFELREDFDKDVCVSWK